MFFFSILINMLSWTVDFLTFLKLSVLPFLTQLLFAVCADLHYLLLFFKLLKLFPECGGEITLVRGSWWQNSQGYVLPAFIQSWASIYPDMLPAYLPPTCDKAYSIQLRLPTSFLQNWKHQACYLLHKQPPAFKEVICPWASGAYRLEAFLF